MSVASQFPNRFYNTSIPNALEEFDAPVVLTINPGGMTDSSFYKVKAPKNLMFVRYRANMWNTDLAQEACDYYEDQGVSFMLTFMAYHDINAIPKDWRDYYVYKKRTLNKYWAITYLGFDYIKALVAGGFVYTCGSVEQSGNHKTLCMTCGNCIREYYNTMERMKHE
jgi:hypothetical protein